MSEKTNSTQRGEAFERLIFALAAMAPTRPGRDQFIESAELASAHSSRELLEQFVENPEATHYAEISNAKKRNAAKTIGRMVASGAFKEMIIPNGKNEKVNLPETGLVAISVGLSDLNAQYDEWLATDQTGPKPSQESMAEEIRKQTALWTVKKADDDGLPILLKDIWIVHGSGTFDMLVLVMYRQSDDFMNYVREVLQRVRGVHKTHTMQISNMLSNV